MEEGTWDYDVIVIEAVPTGENVAGRASQGGSRVALIENELFGGECSHRSPNRPPTAPLPPTHPDQFAAARLRTTRRRPHSSRSPANRAM